MRVLMLSKALLASEYRKKLSALSDQGGIDLLAATPERWGNGGTAQRFEPGGPTGIALRFLPCRFNGHFHLHYYPTLGRLLDAFEPDLLHIDEEPYNLATAHSAHLARRRGIKSIFFAWQNLARSYPPPFAQLERYCYRRCAAIAGTTQAAAVLQHKGFDGPLAEIPQFGVDPDHFCPVPASACSARALTIGFAGRLVEEKGLTVLESAAAMLRPRPHLRLAGSGPLAPRLEASARRGPLKGRIELVGQLDSGQMPSFLRSLDLLVLPSLTRANWMEQFGRVLIEAMACGIPVIGTRSGAIPLVIGQAGLIVPEGRARELADAMTALQDPKLRQELGCAGRERVLARYTHYRVAKETAGFYSDLLSA